MSRLTTLLKAQKGVRVVDSDSLFEDNEYAYCVAFRLLAYIPSIGQGGCHRSDCVTSATDRCYLNSKAGIERLESELCPD